MAEATRQSPFIVWGVSENTPKAKFYELTPSGKKQLASDAKAWARLTRAVGLVLDMS